MSSRVEKNFAACLFGAWLQNISGVAFADRPVVIAVESAPGAAGYRISVTVRHEDGGWDHYADRWEVITPDGTSLGRRVLYHPHVHEQPFTRSLDGIEIPTGLDRVGVIAHDSVHGEGEPFWLNLDLEH